MNLARFIKKRRKEPMSSTVRARMRRGMLELLEKVDLAEGTEVTITILDEPSAADREAFRRAAGGWKDTVDADTLINNIYASRLVSTRPVPKL
jgi:predicted DNA-binding antitoxin AbrB/MazE fold protein